MSSFSIKQRITLSSALAIFITALLASNAYSLSDREQQIADRIAPVGDVCLEGEECAAATAAVASSAASSGPRSGEDIYNTACFACHGAGVAGAPKVGDVAAWEPRISAGMDSMVSNAINGINAMPPMGTCMDCSEEEIKLTVEFMAEGSQ